MTEHDFETFCNFVRHLLHTKNYNLEVQPGRRYIKLIMVRGTDSASVWAFVEKETGFIFKPATWRAPAKHQRGNVADPQTYRDYRWTGPHYLR